MFKKKTKIDLNTQNIVSREEYINEDTYIHNEINNNHNDNIKFDNNNKNNNNHKIIIILK